MVTCQTPVLTLSGVTPAATKTVAHKRTAPDTIIFRISSPLLGLPIIRLSFAHPNIPPTLDARDQGLEHRGTVVDRDHPEFLAPSLEFSRIPTFIAAAIS